jgi:hypothetical protein
MGWARWHLIPPRLSIDLSEVGIGGEGVPGFAAGIDDSLIVGQQAVR